MRTITNSALVLQATEEPAEKPLLFRATLFFFCSQIYFYILLINVSMSFSKREVIFALVEIYFHLILKRVFICGGRQQ